MKKFLRWHLRDWFIVTFVLGVAFANHAAACESCKILYQLLTGTVDVVK